MPDVNWLKTYWVRISRVIFLWSMFVIHFVYVLIKALYNGTQQNSIMRDVL